MQIISLFICGSIKDSLRKAMGEKMETVKKRVAFVTGSTRGIGLAIVKSLLLKDYIVISNSRTEDSKQKEMVFQWKKADHNFDYMCGDITDECTAAGLIQRIVRQYGKLDVLINNVGTTLNKPFIRTTEEDYRTVLRQNLSGTVYCSKYALKNMITNRYGRIVNISSIAGTNALAFEALYSMAKAGINGFTKAIAKEYGAKGITCNALAPGVIDTGKGDKDFNDIRLQIPAGRVGEVKDIAAAAAFLCSEEAAYINGEIIKADGGLFM